MIVDFKATLDVRKTGTNIVTKLWNDIYVINVPEAHDIDCSSEMYVFEGRAPFRLLRRLDLKEEVHFPLDFASNEREKSLYILSIGRDEVRYIHRNFGHKDESSWKLVKGGKKLGLNLVKWIKFGDDFKPKSMSVSKSGRLLMVSDEPSPSLRVYGPADAQLLQSVFLPRDIKRPLHAVELSSGHFVVYHQTLAVCLLSRDGKTIIRSYRPENDEQRTGGRLCVDSNDRVFVADTYNHRVILLDSNLLWKQVLISTIEQKDEENMKTAVRFPDNLYYDEANKEIGVCGIYGVYVYTIMTK